MKEASGTAVGRTKDPPGWDGIAMSWILGSGRVSVSELLFRWGRAVEIWVITIDQQLSSTIAVLCGKL